MQQHNKSSHREVPYKECEPLVLIEDELEAYNFKDVFKIIHAQLQYCMTNGKYSSIVTRICFERRDSVGVLLHDPQQGNIILVRQFRYPAFVRLREHEDARAGSKTGWLLEIVAGILEEGDTTTEDVAQRELLEEAGYYVKGTPKHITTAFLSPGGSSERIHIFIAEVDRSKKTQTGGGLLEEGEDTEVVVLKVDEALAMIASGEIQDAKTVLALQHLELLKYQKQSR